MTENKKAYTRQLLKDFIKHNRNRLNKKTTLAQIVAMVEAHIISTYEGDLLLDITLGDIAEMLVADLLG